MGSRVPCGQATWTGFTPTALLDRWRKASPAATGSTRWRRSPVTLAAENARLVAQLVSLDLRGGGLTTRGAITLVGAALALLCAEVTARAETSAEGAERPPAEDDWLDLSSFLEKPYGFLPFFWPTDPAVGKGVGGGVVFLGKPSQGAEPGTQRPSITVLGGLGTDNGTWGAYAVDSRYWLDDDLHTLVAAAYASAHLDFYGIGQDSLLQADPLRYEIAPTGGLAQARYRLGGSSIWAGLRYLFTAADVSFEALRDTAGVPDYERPSRVGGASALLTLDTRDNIFTPLRGTLLEGSVGLFAPWLGGDDTFERVTLLALQYIPLPAHFYLGLRGEAAAMFGDAPFYMAPFVDLRAVPLLRYQGEEMALLEGELRWQFWKRFSLVAFGGGGGAWNDFERLDNWQGVVSGGGGFRYELARRYGIHAGFDAAVSRDAVAFFFEVGSAWMRP